MRSKWSYNCSGVLITAAEREVGIGAVRYTAAVRCLDGGLDWYLDWGSGLGAACDNQ